MKLLRFKAQNLFSLGDVDLDLAQRGLVLVTGHSLDEGGANGSGKSSLSNKGILWTLYGLTASGERADAAVNRFAPPDSQCVGLVDLECNSGSQHRIVRSRNPNRLSVFDLASGADISCKTEKETQALINKLLGRSRETFLQTDFFGQGKLSAFLDLTPKAQVELLETILPFDMLAELSDSTKKFLSKLQEVQYRVDRKLSEQTGKQLEAQRQERVLSDAIDKWEQDQDAKRTALEAQIEATEGTSIAKKMEEWGQVLLTLPNLVECDRVVEACEKNIRYIDAEMQKIRNAIADRQIAKTRLIYSPMPTQNGTCPTCSQMINNYQYDQLYKAHNLYCLELMNIDKGLQLCNEEVMRYQSLREQNQFRLDETRVIINKIKTIEAEQVRFQQSSEELATLKERLGGLRSEVNPYTVLYTEASKTVSTTIQNLTLHKARLDEVNNDRHALEFWRDAFTKELKNEFINQVCPFIERRSNDHLDGLGNPQIKVLVGTRKHLKSTEERSEFTISASSATGGNTYDSLSGGERQLVNFAVGLALADLAELQTDGPSFFMVLDEPFMALDARNSENLVNYLNSYLGSKKETILLVSNEANLKNLIPNRINVVKEHGITRIEG